MKARSEEKFEGHKDCAFVMPLAREKLAGLIKIRVFVMQTKTYLSWSSPDN
jgi:hypothetical protein